MMWFLFLVAATDVTSAAEKHKSVVQYLQERDDLDATSRTKWEAAARRVFGGAALKSGDEDEGITAAKSVFAFGLFHQLDPVTVASCAYDAKNDVYSFVPPPLAINYQLAKLLGRTPKVPARWMAFDFPKYFDDELAPDTVNWWADMLERGKAIDPERTRKDIAATRRLMRPRLRQLLWEYVELMARRRAAEASGELASAAQLIADSEQLALDIERDYKGVGASTATDAYDRYAALSRELSVPVNPRPVVALKPRVVTPPPQVDSVPREEPSALAPTTPGDDKPSLAQTPAKGKKGKKGKKPVFEKPIVDNPPANPDERTGESTGKTAGERPGEPDTASAENAPPTSSSPQFAPNDPTLKRVDLASAPLPGDPLVVPNTGWERTLASSVQKWVGTRYVFGGTGRDGIDCSAFVREVVRDSLRRELPRVSHEQARYGITVDQTQLKKGDLVYFDTLDRGRISHVAVYVGDGKITHATSSRGVTPEELNHKWLQRAYRSARRIIAH